MVTISSPIGRVWMIRIPTYVTPLITYILCVSYVAALEALRAKAEPPSEDEFKETYKKCKFALNLIAKLGHHLSAPSASELQAGVFSNYISKLVSINKGSAL